jgi:hypothetical protein
MKTLFRTGLSFVMLATAGYGQERVPSQPQPGVRQFKVEEHRLGPIDKSAQFTISSSDGCHLAHVKPKGTKFQVVVDGVEGPEYDQIMFWLNALGAVEEHSLRLSPDGKRVAYFARKGATYHLVVDGVEGPGYDDNGEGRLRFSPAMLASPFSARTAGNWRTRSGTE